MIKFYIQTNSLSPSFTFVENQQVENISLTKSNLELITKISKLFNIENIFVDSIKNKTIGENGNYITVIHDYNIDNYLNKDLNNVIFLVHDEKNLFNNILKLSEIVSGYIDLQLKYIDEYCLETLKSEFEKIIMFMKEFKQLNILQLNSFYNDKKFSDFGVDTFFISPELDVYSHPNFYYTNDKKGLICSFIDLDFLNVDIFQKLRPHIVCKTCNTFYCDRNIYYNKLNTSEFIVPYSKECKKTTFLSYYSKKLYNNITGENINVDEDLDTVFDFEPDEAYKKMINDEIQTNNIKGIKYR